MKFAASIVTILAAFAVVAEAHNVRVGSKNEQHHEKRTHAQEGKIRDERYHEPRADSDEDGDPTLIIGGSQSNKNEFPYYVDNCGCGGSLIAPKIVLTAAHCQSTYCNDGSVIVNGYKRGEVGEFGIKRFVANSQSHPEYVGGRWKNDIQLILLDEPVTGLSVKLEVNDKASFPADGADLTNLGIGRQDQDDGSLVIGTFLFDVVIPVANSEECVNHWGLNDLGQPKINPDIMICAGNIGKGACQGDSGGPLVVRNGNTHIQVGIVTGGRGDCAKNTIYENVYARTSGFFNWIKEVVCDQWEEEADFCPSSGGGGGDDDGCTNLSGWTDSFGDGCDYYEENEGACEEYGDDSGTDGKTPVDACCECQ